MNVCDVGSVYTNIGFWKQLRGRCDDDARRRRASSAPTPTPPPRRCAGCFSLAVGLCARPILRSPATGCAPLLHAGTSRAMDGVTGAYVDWNFPMMLLPLLVRRAPVPLAGGAYPSLCSRARTLRSAEECAAVHDAFARIAERLALDEEGVEEEEEGEGGARGGGVAWP